MLKVSALIATAIFVLCDSTIVEKDKRCMVKDEECLKSLLENLVKRAPDGKSDPYVFKDLNVQIFGLLNFTIIDAIVKGFKQCYSTGFKNNIEAGLAEIEIMCDYIGIEDNVTIEFTPALSALLGGINVQATGGGSGFIEKLKLNADIAFEVKKQDDGEVYFNLKREESSMKFDVLGKLKIITKTFYVGGHDFGEFITDITNNYWKSYIYIVGQPLFGKVFNIFFKDFDTIFKIHPAKEFIIDDLTYLVKYNK